MLNPYEAAPETIAFEAHAVAARGAFDGRETEANRLYLLACRRVAHGTSLIFTRDTGHHSSGWFRNPDFERCWHLSLSPAPSRLWTPDTPDLDRRLRDRWLAAFFGEWTRLLWAESPHSSAGKRAGVWHWRLFCDEHWEPILPRGEVYSSEFTEKGWKSASELGVEIVSTLSP